jgi:hypothetical protein
MMRNIRRRLEIIESKIPREPIEEDDLKTWFALLIRCSIAYYVGEPTPKDSVMSAYMRALGYEDAFAFNSACRTKDPDLAKRSDAATEKLFAKFGIDNYRNCDWGAFVAALERMEASLSDFSNRPFGVKHFQTIHRSSVDVAHGLVLLFGIDTKAVPSWDSRTRRNNLLGGLTVNRTAGPSGQANSPHPSSREGHLSTA